MCSWCHSGKCKILYVEVCILSLIDGLAEALDFTISEIRDSYRLNLDFSYDVKTNKCVDDYRIIPLSVEYSCMIVILVTFNTTLSCIVIHLIPTTC